MDAWHNIMRKVLQHGAKRNDRTGVGTLALFGEMVVFDNLNSFPAVTTKKLAFGQMAAELSCFIRGHDNLTQFHSRGCTIWDGNGTSEYWLPRSRCEGDLGRIYGVQWRDWKNSKGETTDQLKELVNGLKRDPHGRRHIVTAWNPGELSEMCLPPCHMFFQCFVNDSGGVDMTVYMRSVDLFLGLPFDIASYALLQRLIAHETGLKSGWLTFFLGDTHIYLNHFRAVNTVLARAPFPEPQLQLAEYVSLFDFESSMASLAGYTCHPSVPAILNV